MSKCVLYVEGNTDGTVGGSYFLMFDLVQGLDRSRFTPIVVFRFDNFLAERLRQSGVEVLILEPRVPLSFKRKWVNALLSPIKKSVNLVGGFILPALSYARFLRRRRVNLVNLNNSITRNHPWMVAALLTGTPCVTHEMGINKAYSSFSRFLGKRLDAVICLSHAIRDAMRACAADFPNTTVIHCGIDLNRYREIETPGDLRLKHKIPEGAPVIGVVGNIREWKGQETIIRATAILRQRFPTIRCVLAGGHTDADMPYLNRLGALCSELNISDNVIFAGFQKNSIDYMRMMDVVAHTSIHPEPFGIVTLEAMSLAKPLVSTTIGGPAEVVVHGVSGLLVKPGEPEFLAGAIASLLDDPVAASAMGREGFKRLETAFSFDRNLSLTMELYERVLSSDGDNQRTAGNAQVHP